MTAGDCPSIDQAQFLGGRLTLRQPRAGHRAGTDAVLVVAAARPYAGRHVVDLGAGVGAIGLALAAFAPVLRATLVEIDPLAAGLAEQNAALNGLTERVAVLRADLRDLSRSGASARISPADLVVMNPPFLDASAARPSPDRRRATAHVMESGGLDLWLASALTLLEPKGSLVLIHRPERLDDLLRGLRLGFGSVALLPVHPRADRAASRVLLLAKKGGRAALSVRPPLILHDGSKFTPLAAALHRGEAELPLR